MPETHQLAAEIGRLNAVERRIIDQFIHRKRQPADPAAATPPFGDRFADQVTAFGGSWSFIVLTIAAIGAWMIVNGMQAKPFDAYPYILLNLVLACMTVLQAPLIMMSQNRQADRDRLAAQHDYEVNAKAEMEIAALQVKLDEIREGQWSQLLVMQEQQLALLRDLAARRERSSATPAQG
ncbi:MAG TPA: DUF1003 domain-containing protein [Vicinamibacterales bacterium]|nr:DUF1003 domain-containing protein [Vicinamibacterales bacterium]